MSRVNRLALRILREQGAGALAYARAAGFEPDPWQSGVLSSKASQIMLACSRQVGKSTTVSLMAADTVEEDDSLVLIFSPSESQSKEMLRKAMNFQRSIPGLKRPVRQSSIHAEWRNGSRIVALSGSEKSSRGYSAPSLVIMDEAQHITEELYMSVRPMLATAIEAGAQVVLIGTPYGKRGFFYDEWTTSAANEYEGWLLQEPLDRDVLYVPAEDTWGWENWAVPATACPRIPRDFLLSERMKMGERWWLQEYFVEFSEADESTFARAHIDAAYSDEAVAWF